MDLIICGSNGLLIGDHVPDRTLLKHGGWRSASSTKQIKVEAKALANGLFDHLEVLSNLLHLSYAILLSDLATLLSYLPSELVSMMKTCKMNSPPYVYTNVHSRRGSSQHTLFTACQKSKLTKLANKQNLLQRFLLLP